MAIAVFTPGLALAAPKEPLVMGPVYVEPAPEAPSRSGRASARTPDRAAAATTPAAPACQISIAELSDPRRIPEVIGMMPAFRSIAAPADRQAWLRSVIEVGLQARGFSPTFAAPGANNAATADAAADNTAGAAADNPTAAPAGNATEAAAGNTADVLTVRISLRSIWLTTMAMNKSGSVVFHVVAARGGQSLDRNYRGDTTSLNWAGTQSEFNDMLNLTFAEALNAMARDLRPMCGGA